MQAQPQAETTHERDDATRDRDDQILWARIQGATLSEIAGRWDLTAERVRQIVVRATRENVLDVAHGLWLEQTHGRALDLEAPGDGDAESFSYVSWLLRELDKLLGVRPRVDYRRGDTGRLAFALCDVDFDPDFSSRGDQ